MQMQMQFASTRANVLLGSQAIPQSARPRVHYNHDDALLASCILDYGGVLLLLLLPTTFPPLSGGEPIDPELSMDRSSLRNNRLKAKRFGELPLV